MQLLSQRHEIALDWLVRLPLLGAYELAMLTDTNEECARKALLDLTHLGWLDSDVALSPEFEPDRLFGLSPAGREEMMKAFGGRGMGTGLPLHQEDIDARWARVETTVGLNRFLAELVLAVRATHNLDVDGLRALSRRRAPDAWWPSSVDAFGFLKVGARKAPFFVAWDRAAAPRIHRTRRLSSWNKHFRETNLLNNVPPVPVLILCPNADTSEQWLRASRSVAERGGEEAVPVAVAESAAVFSADPLDRLWRSANISVESPLMDQVGWRDKLPVVYDMPRLLQPPRILREDGPKATAPGAATPTSEPPYILYRRLGSNEKRVLEWLAFHPLLTPADISILLHGHHQQTRIILFRLEAAGFVGKVHRSAAGDLNEETYFFLAKAGLQAMAFRDGVPERRYDQYGSLAAESDWDGGGRLQTLLRQFDHSVGINRFFVRLIADSASHGVHALAWIGAADAAVRVSDESRRWIRPDGAADIAWNGRRYRILLELDRNTMRGRQMNDKLKRYAEYFDSRPQEVIQSGAAQQLYLVTTTPAREEDLAERFKAFDQGRYRLWTTTLSLTARLGPFGQIWSDGAGQRLGLRETLNGPAGHPVGAATGHA